VLLRSMMWRRVFLLFCCFRVRWWGHLSQTKRVTSLVCDRVSTDHLIGLRPAEFVNLLCSIHIWRAQGWFAVIYARHRQDDHQLGLSSFPTPKDLKKKHQQSIQD
jgi:hypothetical protein